MWHAFDLCQIEHLAEAFAVSGNVVTILLEVGQSSIDQEFAGHLLSEELGLLLDRLADFVCILKVLIRLELLLLAHQTLSSDFLLEGFAQVIEVLSDLEDRVALIRGHLENFVVQARLEIFLYSFLWVWIVASVHKRHQFLEFFLDHVQLDLILGVLA